MGPLTPSYPSMFVLETCDKSRPAEWVLVKSYGELNLLTPNVNYNGRTAPLTSEVAFYIFIQQI